MNDKEMMVSDACHTRFHTTKCAADGVRSLVRVALFFRVQEFFQHKAVLR